MSGTPISLALPAASPTTALGAQQTTGAQQYIRAIKLTVTSPHTMFDLSLLRIKFTITSRTTGSPRTAVIRVYNLAEDTVKKIRATGPKPYGVETQIYTPQATQEAATVVLEAGYTHNCGGIFAGGLVQTRSGRESPTDTYLDLFANDADTFAGFGTINMHIAAGTTDLQVLNLVVKNLQDQGYPISVAYTPSNLDLNMSIRSQTLSGKATDVLREWALKTGCTWHIISVPSPAGYISKLYLVPLTGCLPGDVVLLSSGKNGDPGKGTGLVGYPQQTENGITARCLLNPLLTPNRRVQIDHEEIQLAAQDQSIKALGSGQWVSKSGIYKVIHLIQHGDSRGQEWYSELTGISVDPGQQQLTGGSVADMDMFPGPGI